MSAVERAGDRNPARRHGGLARVYDLHDSPLWACADRHSLWGRIVTDPREVEAIRARVLRYGRWRWFR